MSQLQRVVREAPVTKCVKCDAALGYNPVSRVKRMCMACMQLKRVIKQEYKGHVEP